MPEVIEIPRTHNPFATRGVFRDANGIPHYDELPATLLEMLAEALPRNAGGKLLKGKLRQQVQWGDPLR